MAVFLTVLKIIGIILLVILGIILLLLALVLFVPIKYETDAIVKDGKVKARIKGGWMFRILKIRGGFSNCSGENEFAMKVKLFGRSLVKAGPSEEPAKAGTGSTPGDPPPAAETDTEAEEFTDPVLGDEYKELKDLPDVKEEPAEEAGRPLEDRGKKKKSKKLSKKEKAEKKRLKARRKAEKKAERAKDDRSFFDRMSDKIDSVIDKKDEIADKISAAMEKKDRVTDIFFSGTYDKAFSKINKNVKMVVRHLKPTHLDGYLRYGTDDPYSTGMIYSASTVLYRFYDDTFEIRPDFTEKVLEADVKMKGRIRLIIPAKAFLSLLLCKNCRQLYREIKSLKNHD